MHKYILNKNLNCIPREELTRANYAQKGFPRGRRTFQFAWKGKGKPRKVRKIKEY